MRVIEELKSWTHDAQPFWEALEPYIRAGAAITVGNRYEIISAIQNVIFEKIEELEAREGEG